MIKLFKNVQNYRCLNGDPHTDGIASGFARYTLIYGTNGAGKSTFSEYLRQLSIGGAPVESTILSSGSNRQHRLRVGQEMDGLKAYVFNNTYVEKNLREFLTGDGQTETIVKLGADSIYDTEEIQTLSGLVARNRRWERSLDGVLSGAMSAEKSAKDDTKAEVLLLLRQFDPERFNTNSYTTTKAQRAMLSDSSTLLGDDEVLGYQETLRQSELSKLSIEDFPMSESEEIAIQANEIVKRAAVGAGIRTLSENPEIAAWVKHGIDLHANETNCQFCGNSLDQSLLSRLQEHFENEDEKTRLKAEALAREAKDHITAVERWAADLPDATYIAASMRSEYEAAVVKVRESAQAAIDWLTNIVATLHAKSDKIATTEWKQHSEFSDFPDLGSARDVVAKHNELSDQLDTLHSEAIAALEGHAAARHAGAFTAALDLGSRCRSLKSLLANQIRSDQDAIRRLEADRHDYSLMAKELTQDLHTIYGKTAFEVTTTQDGAGYVALRNGQAANHLSEGEQRMLALAYFLRTLDAEDVDRPSALVVIDDPVTSLDRDNLFATSAWLDARLSDVGQAIILTHSFEFLQLQLRVHGDEIRESRSMASTTLHSEELLKANVLEISMYTAPESGSESIMLRAFPQHLLNAPSEYHYLFRKVAEACTSRPDEDWLPLVGNAARRLVEGFLAFKEPNQSSFGAQISSITPSSLPMAVSNKVKTFLHDQSHRRSPDPSERGVGLGLQPEIKNAMAFLRACDADHFSKMCAAVGIEERNIISGRDLAILEGRIPLMSTS